MPSSIQPLLIISPTLSASALQELLHLMNAVMRGAFPQQSGWKILFTESPEKCRAEYHLQLPSGFSEEEARTLTVRVAESTLYVISVLAIEFGVPARPSGTPSQRVLQLPGLNWYRAQRCLTKFFSLLESPPTTSFMSALTEFRLRVTTGRPLGCTSAENAGFLCTAIICRRTIASGEIVRVQSTGISFSIFVPSEIGASALKEGVVVHTVPIVGLIPKRLIQFKLCQRSLF